MYPTARKKQEGNYCKIIRGDIIEKPIEHKDTFFLSKLQLMKLHQTLLCVLNSLSITIN